MNNLLSLEKRDKKVCFNKEKFNSNAAFDIEMYTCTSKRATVSNVQDKQSDN